MKYWLIAGPAIILGTGILVLGQPPSGVIVDQVESGSPAAKAGLQVGDVVLSWSRGSESGPIRSPFDIPAIELDQGLRGQVTLHGRRDVQQRRWELTTSPWGVVFIPPLEKDFLMTFRQGQSLLRAGKAKEAVAVWQTAAAQVQGTDARWLATWLWTEGASALRKARQWNETDAAFRSALDGAESVGPVASVLLLKGWAEAFHLRSNWAQAEQLYQQSLTKIQEHGIETLTAAQVLTGLGDIARSRGDLPKAEERYQRALALTGKLAPRSLLFATVLTKLGLAASDRGNLAKADEYNFQALAVSKELDPGGMTYAAALNNLGQVAWKRGDLAKAGDHYEEAVRIVEKVTPGGVGVASILNNMGSVAQDRGDLAKAEDYYRQALTLGEKLEPGSLDVAINLNNLGLVARARGDLAKAEDYYTESLRIKQRLAPGSITLSISLNNLGLLAEDRRDLAKAADYYRQALSIREKLAPGTLTVAISLNNLGTNAYLRGDPAKAEDYTRQALVITEKLTPGTLSMARSLNNLGRMIRDRGDLTTAEDYMRQALAIHEKLAPGSLAVATGLTNLGSIADDRREFAKAEGYHRQALAIQQRLAPGSSDLAATLDALGSSLRKAGRPDQAVKFFEQAVQALESQMARFGGSSDDRSGFRATYRSYYSKYLDLLLSQKQSERAFHVMERSRARSLLEMLAERDLVFGADLPGEVQRERKLNAADYDRIQAQIARLSPTKDTAQIEQRLARLRELSFEREQIMLRVKRASPRLAALQYPQPLDLAATREALDPGTVLLSYSVGADRTDLFVVQARGAEPGISVFPLPLGEKALRSQVEELRGLIQQRDATSALAFRSRSRALYDLLLKPAEAAIAASKRILLVPDGPLHTVPFAALLRSEKQYLIEWKPLHTIVSATVYAELKKTRQPRGSAPGELIAFGDPSYPNPDAETQQAGSPELRAAHDRGLVLAPLRFSGEEVRAIAALYPKHSRTFLGADATEERAKALKGPMRYLHFAAHGLLDERFPLNSAVVLTIPGQSKGDRENGLLQAWEIFDQVRWQADLVVLSACQTGLGKELGGEGLVGLTRALQYAGARSVLASLWSIEDRRTAQLMRRFYEQLEKGQSKDEALRTAQLALLRSPYTARPFYWASFSLSGDWQ